MPKNSQNPHIGSTLESWLKEEGILEETQALATKKLIAYRLLDILKEENITQADLAKKLGTSKAAISRLLNPKNLSLTLITLLKVAQVLGKRINLTIE